ncbi:MAG: ABC transporter substrate-binding protein [Chloroflexota bacterium]
MDAESMDPYITTSSASQSIMHAIFDTLLIRDDQMKIKPGLATSWETPDSSTWIFHLRQGVKFHNGQPFDAQAVKFSFDRFTDPTTKNPQASFMKPVKSVQAVDAHTVKFTTNGPYAAFSNVLFDYFFIMSPAVKGQDASKTVIGTGPYQFVEWKRARHVALKANDAYWGPKPKVAEAMFLPIPEPSTRLIELKSGAADIVSPLEQVQYSQATADGASVAKTQGAIITIMFNCAMKPFDSTKVRQAANYAVNKQAIIKGVMRGAGYQLPAVLRPRMLGYDASLAPYPFDPAHAKALLSEAGAGDLTVELGSSNGRYQNDKLVSEAVAEQLNNVGFKAKVTTSDWSTYVQNIIGHKLQFFLIAETSPLSEIALPQTLLPKEALYQNYKNTKAQSLITQAGHTLDSTTRAALYKQANQLLHTDPPWLFLFAQEDAYGVAKRVSGFKPRTDSLIWINDLGLNS